MLAHRALWGADAQHPGLPLSSCRPCVLPSSGKKSKKGKKRGRKGKKREQLHFCMITITPFPDLKKRKSSTN